MRTQELARARFGAFELEVSTGELSRTGIPIHLPPQPFRILVLLMSQPGRLVTREELRREIWGDQKFVDFEHGLNFAIKKIRDTLGDDAEHPRFVETLPRRGYRFIAPVEWVSTEGTEPVGPVVPTTSVNALSESAEEVGASKATWFDFFHVRTNWAWMIVAAGVVAISISIWNAKDLRHRLIEALHLRLNQTRPHISSIAVLPLENLSSDPQQEYFTDGLTDTLITNLGQVGTMRVISRASVMQYKRGKTPLPRIARDLDVDAVVEGTVLRAGSTVRISIQLLDARADRHLWAQTYEHNLGDVLKVERQAALAIAHEVSGRLSTAQEMRLKSPESIKPEALDAYLQGSYLLAERSVEAETGARGYFEQALRADPKFAQAYGGLALSYSVSCGVAPDFSRAEAYALKALVLDQDSADAHTALGYIRLTQHRYEESEERFKQAIALNPNYALAHDLYADYWLYMGRPTEALAENDKALQLDPFSYAYNYEQSGILYTLGKYDAALEKAQFVATLNPQVAGINGWSVQIYWAAGRVPEAVAGEREIAADLRSPQIAHDAQEVAAVYSSSGLRAAVLREATLRSQRRTRALRSGVTLSSLDAAASIATLYSFLSDRENTLHWLNESLKEGPGYSPQEIMCSPSFDFLRSDPQFKTIQRRLGLPV